MASLRTVNSSFSPSVVEPEMTAAWMALFRSVISCGRLSPTILASVGEMCPEATSLAVRLCIRISLFKVKFSRGKGWVLL